MLDHDSRTEEGRDDEPAAFTLTIELGNDAMNSTTDVADALHRVRRKVIAGLTSGTIMDSNGNSVGRFEFGGSDD